MKDKKKTKNIKVRDLQPKKDAKGGQTGRVTHPQNHPQNHPQTGPQTGPQTYVG